MQYKCTRDFVRGLAGSMEPFCSGGPTESVTELQEVTNFVTPELI